MSLPDIVYPLAEHAEGRIDGMRLGLRDAQLCLVVLTTPEVNRVLVKTESLDNASAEVYPYIERFVKERVLADCVSVPRHGSQLHRSRVWRSRARLKVKCYIKMSHVIAYIHL